MSNSSSFLFVFSWSMMFWIILPISSSGQATTRYEFSENKMGTRFNLLIYSESEEKASRGADAVFQRIDQLNQIFSDYMEDSELSRLSSSSGTRKKVYVSADLWKVLQMSREFSRKSGGAFDVTVGPLSKLWRRAIRRGETPDPQQIKEALARVNWKWIKFFPHERKIKLKKPGMRLDLGGIAKGYAVDAAYKVLKRMGLSQSLIDGGGDIYAGASPPGENGWRISLSIAADRSSALHTAKVIILENQAIASSGSLYKNVVKGDQRHSHIVDPVFGEGITKEETIFVVGPECVKADAIATTLSILPVADHDEFISKFPFYKHSIEDKPAKESILFQPD